MELAKPIIEDYKNNENMYFIAAEAIDALQSNNAEIILYLEKYEQIVHTCKSAKKKIMINFINDDTAILE